MKIIKIFCICLLFSSKARSIDHLSGPFVEKPVITQTFPKDVAKNILHIRDKAKFEIRTDKVHCNTTAVQNSTYYDLNYSIWGTVPEINQVDYADFSFGEGEFNPNWYGHLENPSKNLDVMNVIAIIRKFDEPTERYFVDLRDVYGTTIPFAQDNNKSLKIFKIGVKTWYPNADSDIFWEDTENNMNLWFKEFKYIGSVVHLAGSVEPYNVDEKIVAEEKFSKGVAWETVALFGPTNMPNDVPGKVQFIGGFQISNNSPDYPALNAADWVLGAQSGADYNAVIEYGLSIGVAVLTSYLGSTECLKMYKHILSGVSAGVRKLIGEVIPEHEGDVFVGGSVSYAVNLAGGDAENHYIIKTGGLDGWDTEKTVQDYQQEDKALITGEEFKFYSKNSMFAKRKFKALMAVSSGDGAANSVISGSFGFHISMYGSSNGVNGSGIFGSVNLAPVRVYMYTETDMSFIRND